MHSATMKTLNALLTLTLAVVALALPQVKDDASLSLSDKSVRAAPPQDNGVNTIADLVPSPPTSRPVRSSPTRRR